MVPHPEPRRRLHANVLELLVGLGVRAPLAMLARGAAMPPAGELAVGVLLYASSAEEAGL